MWLAIHFLIEISVELESHRQQSMVATHFYSLSSFASKCNYASSIAEKVFTPPRFPFCD